MTAAPHISKLLHAVEKLREGSSANLDDFLASGNQFLGTQFGIISKIDEDRYKVMHVSAPEGTLEVGATFDLGSTYCVLTLAAQDVLPISSMTESDHNGHPCHKQFGLECYIGVPLRVNGQRYGTLNFSNPEVRKLSWSEEEQNLLRLMAKAVESHLGNEMLQDQLSQALFELEHANDKLRSFASHASHDLRGPMRQIRRLTNFIVTGDSDPEETARFLGMIGLKCEQMENLISDLIEYARADQRGTKTTELLPFGHIIANAVDMLTIPEGIKVTLDIQPVEDVPCEVRMRSVLYNLLSNAIGHHTKKTGGQVVLEARLASNGDLVVRVEDDGKGIPERFRDKVFEPFQKLSKKGTGLGLSIAKKIATEHGGDLELVQGKLQGACFKVTWPLRPQALRPA